MVGWEVILQIWDVTVQVWDAAVQVWWYSKVRRHYTGVLPVCGAAAGVPGTGVLATFVTGGRKVHVVWDALRITVC